MRKFICSVLFFGFFAFLYLVVFPSYVEAGNGPPPCLGPTCDILCPGGGEDCFGTPDDNVICGSSSGEEIFAGKGNDVVCGFGGGDIIHGGFGCDCIDGGTGNDEIHGGWGEDLLQGGTITTLYMRVNVMMV